VPGNIYLDCLRNQEENRDKVKNTFSSTITVQLVPRAFLIPAPGDRKKRDPGSKVGH